MIIFFWDKVQLYNCRTSGELGTQEPLEPLEPGNPCMGEPWEPRTQTGEQYNLYKVYLYIVALQVFRWVCIIKLLRVFGKIGHILKCSDNCESAFQY